MEVDWLGLVPAAIVPSDDDVPVSPQLTAPNANRPTAPIGSAACRTRRITRLFNQAEHRLSRRHLCGPEVVVDRANSVGIEPCRLEAEPLKEAADWLESYRRFWEQSFDRLGEYLRELQSKEEKHDPQK